MSLDISKRAHPAHSDAHAGGAYVAFYVCAP